MSSPQSNLNDPRVYLSVERTFLAWIRTALALMGFGFVVARFGLFLSEFALLRGEPNAHPHGVSARFGTALVILGVLLTVAALVRYVRLLKRLRQGEALITPSRSALFLGGALGVIGAVVTVYLMTSF
jgi:putative membrane protein